MVQKVLLNLKSFYPTAGHDLLGKFSFIYLSFCIEASAAGINVSVFMLDLPVCSPLCHAALKTLQRWEQLLLKRLEIFGGPPSQYISTQLQDESVSSGPAILRHKALLEPANTPFK